MPTDPMWCFENYVEAAEYIDQLEKQRDELLAKLDRAQAEIRALKSELFDANNKPIRVCEACAIYPCKCE